MTDWRKLAKSLALADGKLDEREVGVLQRELFADNKIDKERLEFLFELRREAGSMPRSFRLLVLDALRPVLLADGSLNDAEANWLRNLIFADGTVHQEELEFMQDLMAAADSVSPEFQKLCEECLRATLPRTG